MRRILVILLMLSSFNISVFAQKEGGKAYPAFTFGAEWSAAADLWSGFHYNFFAPEGYRVDLRGNSFNYRNDSEAYVHFGYNFNENWNLALYVGYAGIGEMSAVAPITLRGTRYFGRNPMADRWFTFLDLGSGICLKRPVQEILSAKTGFGYRLSLSRDTKLDLLLAARSIYSHKNITYDGVPIDPDRTNRNDFIIAGVTLGMAVVF